MVSTVDLLVLARKDLLLLILKILLAFLTKQATLMRGSTVLSLPPLLVFPGLAIWIPKDNNCFLFCADERNKKEKLFMTNFYQIITKIIFRGDNLDQSRYDFRYQCYKTFCGRKLQIFVIS